jgi:hypothetical protein
LRYTSSWSNFRDKRVSSFFASSIRLKENIASIPLASTLSYIRKTTGNGNLLQIKNLKLQRNRKHPLITEHREKPLRAIHARFYALSDEMNVQNWEEFFD